MAQHPDVLLALQRLSRAVNSGQLEDILISGELEPEVLEFLNSLKDNDSMES